LRSLCLSANDVAFDTKFGESEQKLVAWDTCEATNIMPQEINPNIEGQNPDYEASFFA
jgi:hypothetical protein